MDRCPRDMLMAQFVSLCICFDFVGASCSRYRFPLYAALYVWNMILKLLHVPGLCSCKMTPSVRAPSHNHSIVDFNRNDQGLFQCMSHKTVVKQEECASGELSFWD